MIVQKLSHSFSGAFRTFSYWVANGTLGYDVLEGIEYRSVLMEEPSSLEQVCAIFANMTELDDAGFIVNAKYAEKRAAQWLHRYIDKTYEVMPPAWKAGRQSSTALHQELIGTNQRVRTNDPRLRRRPFDY